MFILVVLQIVSFASLHAVSATSALAIEPDWRANVSIPLTGRPNPYQWDEATLAKKIKSGKLHTLHYPVSVTGLKMPARAALKTLDLEPGDPLFGFLKTALRLQAGIKDFKGFWKWLGLNDYPETEDGAEYAIPFKNGKRPLYPMGVTLADWSPSGKTQVLTMSCAACHSATMFGKPILGLTNRFPGSNEFFKYAQDTFHKLKPGMFRVLTGGTREEKELYAYSRERISAVGLKIPQTLGLDTSLGQVAFSLAKRELGPWAERSPRFEREPRKIYLDDHPADSKPMVWWNIKYKNRWLTDGSVLSGNPILTVLLWNEIGRGVDLHELVDWTEKNGEVIEDLTTTVFATEAPKWNYYMPAGSIQVERARRGEALFAQNCAHCHGEYRKDWSRGVETLEVKYHALTPVKDVGTSPGRREGMRSLAEGLNPLEFSRKYGIVIEEQKGYVPPPLSGIWARYPYFHNNSIPNLCTLMTPPELRPRFYFAGEPVKPGRDYDLNCVGYPTGDRVPAEWKKDLAYRYDSAKAGMSNAGHYERIFRRDGVERYTPAQKQDLIEYLKTL